MTEALPTGTVTLLFTDIEGSTRLLDELGERYADVLAEHRRVLRDAFRRNGGVEVDTQGDSFFYVFAKAGDAVEAARDAQLALADSSVRVRMGVHTGEPTLTDEGYVGVDVHRAARIMGAGHGGQVLLSRATREALDSDIDLRDLGEHRLKDLAGPEWLFQLGEREFPPLKSLNNTNLPAEAASLVGREGELQELTALLTREDVRLATLTGPGGAGKTRLALRLAAELVDQFRNGVFLVQLAPLSESSLVVPTLAQTLGVKERPGEELHATLAEHLADKTLLLVLDNFEQVLEAALEVDQLLASARHLKVVVTSREPLRLSGEHEYAVPPLAEPDAVSLFAQRARAAKADFALDGNAGTVAELCNRLDRLPLALELAAARIKVLSPQALLERLEERLPLLTGGARSLPERQRTLRATIDWSYELLTEEERRVFARFAVFAGGCTLEAAEEVCEAHLDTLQSLVDKSLLRHEEGADGEPRFTMLETVREYAAGRLEEGGDADEVRRLHLLYFLALAERTQPEVMSHTQMQALERLEREHANFRAALQYGFGGSEGGELATRLAVALVEFSVSRGHLSEGRRWLEEGLARGELSPSTQAKALRTAGHLAHHLGDLDLADKLVRQAVAAFEELGDEVGLCHSLGNLAWIIMFQGDPVQAAETAERAIAVGRRAGDTWALAVALTGLAAALSESGDLNRAKELLAESRSLFEEVGDGRSAALQASNLADVALAEGEYARAWDLAQSAVALGRSLRDSALLRAALINQAEADLYRSRWTEAFSALRESLQLASSAGDKFTSAVCLSGLSLAIASWDPERAALLFGASESASLGPSEIGLRDRAKAILRTDLGPERFADAAAVGRAMSLEKAVEFALETTADDKRRTETEVAAVESQTGPSSGTS